MIFNLSSKLCRVFRGGYGYSSDEASEEEDGDESTADMDAGEGAPAQGVPPAGAKEDTSDHQTEEEKRTEKEKKKKEKGDAKRQTMELQWKSYVTNLKKSGTLSSALSVCDVSGSMAGQPMEVSLQHIFLLLIMQGMTCIVQLVRAQHWLIPQAPCLYLPDCKPV